MADSNIKPFPAKSLPDPPLDDDGERGAQIFAIIIMWLAATAFGIFIGLGLHSLFGGSSCR